MYIAKEFYTGLIYNLYSYSLAIQTSRLAHGTESKLKFQGECSSVPAAYAIVSLAEQETLFALLQLT